MSAVRLSVCMVGMLAAAASADVTETGPFEGVSSESFEALGPPGSLPGPVDIFGGDGTISDTFANNIIIALNLISFKTDEEIFPFDGNFMGLSVSGFTTVTFDEPAYSFGGYIGTVDILEPGVVRFLDADGEVIDELPFELPLNDWQWYGWTSDTPFSTVEIESSTNPNKPVVYDDLEVSFTPPAECTGDVSGDGVIDSTDLNMVLGGFGCTGGGCDGDADGDGDTDSEDLNTVLGAFGEDC